MKHPYRAILIWLLFTGIFALVLFVEAKAGEKPNMILIMCDDLGWGDVGFNGGTHSYATSRRNGGQRPQSYSLYAQALGVFADTASVVTGRHHDRTGIYTANNGHLREGEFTLYEALSSVGYATGRAKWHMGTLTREIRDSNRGGKDVVNYSPPWRHEIDVTFSTEANTHVRSDVEASRFKRKQTEKSYKEDFREVSSRGWHALADGADRTFYGTRYWTGRRPSLILSPMTYGVMTLR